MKQTDINSIRKIADALSEYSETLAEIQDQVQSEALDQALDDLSLAIDELFTAIEE